MMSGYSLQQLIDAYCESPAEGLRNAIISRSIPLVRSIIGKIRKPEHPLSQTEDLESAGINGVLQAIDSYDPGRGIQFNTYAYYRIRGSIVDYLRKIDHLPRNHRSGYGKVQAAWNRLAQSLGREPTDDEVAEELKLSTGKYRQLLSDVQQRNALSLDSLPDSPGSTLYDLFENPDSILPDNRIENREQAETLRLTISKLNKRDRLILTLYYYEEMTMNEIALLLDLTEARISQIIGKLLIRLRTQFELEDRQPHKRG